MTEGEAKTKWCPFARVVMGADLGPQGTKGVDCGGAKTSFNRVGVNPNIIRTHAATNCIGSNCMAWRTIEVFGDKSPYLGYCGLAGPDPVPRMTPSDKPDR